MQRLLGLLAGALTSFVETYVSTTRNQIKESYPKVRAGICGPECRLEDRPSWKTLPRSDPRSHDFQSYLKNVWYEDLSPDEAVDARLKGISQERIMFDYTVILLDDLVDCQEMQAHEAQHLKSYYEAMILRALAQY